MQENFRELRLNWGKRFSPLRRSEISAQAPRKFHPTFRPSSFSLKLSERWRPQKCALTKERIFLSNWKSVPLRFWFHYCPIALLNHWTIHWLFRSHLRIKPTMRDAGFTKQERNFVAFMRLLGLVYLFFAFAFLFFSEWIFNYVSQIGITFFHWKHTATSASDFQFWFVLGLSSFFVLSYCALKAANNNLRHIHYASVILVAKATSTLAFLYVFYTSTPLFLYLVSGIVDAILFLVTLHYYSQAKRSRPSHF